MPQLQVIARQEDPTAKLISDAGNDISSVIQKKQEMAQNSQAISAKIEELKLKKQMAQTEEAKNDLDANVKALTYLQTVGDNYAGTPALPAMLKAGQDAFGKYWGQAHIDAGTAITGVKSIKAQKDAAETDLATQRARLDKSTADIYQRYTEGGQQAQQSPNTAAMSLPSGQSGDVSGQPTVQQRTQAPNQGVVMTGMSGGRPNFTNLDAVSQVEATKTRAGDVAKQNLARENLSKELNNFFTLDDQIARSSGGLIDRVKRGANLSLSAAEQNTPEGQVAAIYNAERARLKAVLARSVDVGNLSATEQAAAEKLISSLYTSKGANQLSRALLQQFATAVGQEDKNGLKNVIQQIKDQGTPRGDVMQRMQGSGGQVQSTKQTIGRFQVEAE